MRRPLNNTFFIYSACKACQEKARNILRGRRGRRQGRGGGGRRRWERRGRTKGQDGWGRQQYKGRQQDLKEGESWRQTNLDHSGLKGYRWSTGGWGRIRERRIPVSCHALGLRGWGGLSLAGRLFACERNLPPVHFWHSIFVSLFICFEVKPVECCLLQYQKLIGGITSVSDPDPQKNVDPKHWKNCSF